jgi:hypothetical protein
MRRWGQEPRIELYGYLGLTYGSAPFRTRREDILTSLAGPVTQIVLLGLPAYLIGKNTDLGDPLFQFTIHMLWFVSFVWGFVNLLPILPLDGGHVAQALWGRPMAKRISVVTAVLALVYVLANHYTFWVIFLWFGGVNAYEIYKESHSTTGGGVTFLPPSPGEYGGGFGGGEYGPGRARGTKNRPKKPPVGRRGDRVRQSHLRAVPDTPEELVGTVDLGPPKTDKIETVAWTALREGKIDDAKRALAKLPPGADVDPFLRPAIDLEAGDTAKAIAGFEAAYVARPEGPNGLLPANLIGRHAEARGLAVRILGHQGGGPAFAVSSLQGHLHYARHYAQSATVGDLLYSDDRANKAQVAFEVACSWSKAGNAEMALTWVEKAIAAGFDSGSTLDREADLAAAREDPAWVSIRALLR